MGNGSQVLDGGKRGGGDTEVRERERECPSISPAPNSLTHGEAAKFSHVSLSFLLWWKVRLQERETKEAVIITATPKKKNRSSIMV